VTPPLPLHVLMTADTVGGVWTYALELSRGLQAFGVKVTLFSMGGTPSREQRERAARLANLALVTTEHRLEWMRHCETDLNASGRELLALEKTLNPDIIHINGYWHASLPFRAPVVTVAHSCVASWWAACRGTPLPEEWSDYGKWVRDGVRASEVLIAPTESFLRAFQRLHGEARLARAIWNGRAADIFRPGVKRHAILAAGRLWDEAKNIALICQAARGLDLDIAVAGDMTGPDGGCVAVNGVTALGLLGADDLARRMAETAIFVAPSLYEPFGLTILEAALCGCALVLGDIPSLRELWDGAAVFVDPRDSGSLRTALRALTADDTRTAELARKARTRAAAYSTARMANAYNDVYRGLAASKLGAVA
jgi:glycogen(starch) synthase